MRAPIVVLLLAVTALSGCMQASEQSPTDPGGGAGAEPTEPSLDAPSPAPSADLKPPTQEASTDEGVPEADAAGPKPNASSQETSDPKDEEDANQHKEQASKPSTVPKDDDEETESAEPRIDDVTIKVDGPEIHIEYSVQAAEASWVTWGDAEAANRWNATSGPGVKSMTIRGDYGTLYAYGITAVGQNAKTSVVGAIATDAWPYRWAAPGEALIAPGKPIINEGGDACTLGFILTSADNRTAYALTAGHCADGGIGSRVRIADGPWFGTHVVVATNGTDYALIQIDGLLRNNVTPSLTHWTGPSGLPHNGSVSHGDTLCLFGESNDLRWGQNHAPCGPMTGTVHRQNHNWSSEKVNYRMDTQIGDSGAPVIAYDTGVAVAIHDGTDTLGAGVTGESICSILHLLRMDGFDLRLATWEYTPPPAADSSPHAEHLPPSSQIDSEEMTGCADSFA